MVDLNSDFRCAFELNSELTIKKGHKRRLDGFQAMIFLNNNGRPLQGKWAGEIGHMLRSGRYSGCGGS